MTKATAPRPTGVPHDHAQEPVQDGHALAQLDPRLTPLFAALGMIDQRLTALGAPLTAPETRLGDAAPGDPSWTAEALWDVQTAIHAALVALTEEAP